MIDRRWEKQMEDRRGAACCLFYSIINTQIMIFQIHDNVGTFYFSLVLISSIQMLH